jgi:hypothetical protein
MNRLRRLTAISRLQYIQRRTSERSGVGYGDIAATREPKEA